MFFRRESLGQTKATSINYLKNIRLLFNHVIHSYVYENSSFPKGFDLSPCMATITKIKLLDQKLNLVYRKKTKQQPAELFIRMTDQAKQLPEYDDVVQCLSVIREKASRATWVSWNARSLRWLGPSPFAVKKTAVQQRRR